MACKIKRAFYLQETELAYLEAYKQTHNFHNLSTALADLLHEHAHRNDVPVTEFFVEELAGEIAERLTPEFKNLRVAVNAAGLDVSVNQLLLNALILYSGLKSLPENDTQQLIEARLAVQKNIEAQRVKKLDQIR